MVARNYRENCGICRHANVCEHTRAAQAIQEAAERFNQPAQEPVADPRDAEIARLKAEVEQLRESEADLIQWIFDGGQRAGIEPADLSPTEVLTRMSDDLAAHKRALAAGPAALRAQVGVHIGGLEACARVVEAAQKAALREDGHG